MTVPLSTVANGSLNQRPVIGNTITGLKRWSCHSNDLPPVSQIKALHVYDFDNTLFMSPLPNQKLWNASTVGRLGNEDAFGGRGWWHDQRILAATGEGIEKEEPRAWEGWWNEQIVELVRLSIEQKDALSVLLTGRGENNFAHLIKRIVASKKLDFDMICLKPEAGPSNERFGTTLKYKQALLADILCTYRNAGEIRVYEDRPRHTKAFRDYLDDFNRTAVRPPIAAEVIQVVDQVTTLDPVVETAEVQRMINAHNAQVPPPAHPLEIKRNVFFTGYLIPPADTTKLLSLVKVTPQMGDHDMKYLANNIMIKPGPADPTLLSKVGGIGYKQTWQVTGFAFHQSNLWVARVAPIPTISAVHTHSNTPMIILATYRNAQPQNANQIRNWQNVPPDKQYILSTTVGEKVQLRVEAESDELDHDHFERRPLKRKHSPPQKGPQTHRNGPNDENRRPNGTNGGYNRGGTHNSNNNNNNHGRDGRSGNQNNRGGRRGGGTGGNRGGGNRRGGRGGYKSLDDVGPGGRFHAQRGEPNYDDYVPAGQGYEAAFPAMRGMGLDGAGGLNYGGK